MTKSERSKYQAKLIERYYDHLDTIMLQKLAELVTELYLADTPKRTNQLWQRVLKAMVKLKVAPAIIDHIMNKRSAEILAKNLQDWLKNKNDPRPTSHEGRKNV
jgi:GTP cyclohydrolase I